MNYKRKRLIITLLPPAAAVLLFVLKKYILFIARFMPPCMFHRMTGLLCPGCGGTRAVKEFISLHFFTAARYNIFIPVLGLAALIFYTQYVISAWIKPVRLIPQGRRFYIFCAVFFAVYCIARNIINFMP